MTPANITDMDALAIYQGARWAHTLTMLQTGTELPVNIADRTFVLSFRHPKTKELLFLGSATLTSDGVDGKLDVLVTAEQTDAISLGRVYCGLRDDLNMPYMEGVLRVKHFTPDPA